jgi:sulfonate transport system permease protein
MSAIETQAPPLGGVRPGEPEPEAPTAVVATTTTGAPQPRRRLRLGGWRWVSPLVLLGLWQLTHVFNLIDPNKLPPPSLVATTAYNLVVHPTPAFGSLQHALLISTERFAIGFGVGASVAVLLALTAALSRIGDAAIDPLMQMVRMLPLFGLIPVFIVWFGIGEAPKIILIALGAAIPLYLNAFGGIRNVDAKLGELAQVLHLNRRELITQIVLPGALPQILVGLRQSLGVAWLALVVAEQVNANAGLGFMISQATQFLRNDVIFVALLVYCILGLLTDWLVRIVERRALRWRNSFLPA